VKQRKPQAAPPSRARKPRRLIPSSARHAAKERGRPDPKHDNVLAKLPESERERVKAAYWRALDEASSQHDGERRLRALVGELADRGFASAAACLADDLEALTAHLRYPLKHRRVWRSTNLLERSLGEVKRRTKVIGRFPGETSCLSLCWAVLDLVIAGANRVRFDDLDRQQIEHITAEQPQRDEEEEEVVAA
jgi:putative transposase